MICPYCGPPFKINKEHGMPASAKTMNRVFSSGCKRRPDLIWELCAHGYGARAVLKKGPQK